MDLDKHRGATLGLSALGWILSGAAIGFGLQLWGEHVAPWLAGAGAGEICAVQDEAFMPVDRFGEFVEAVDSTMNTSPYGGVALEAPLKQSYRQGRVKGAISSAALRPEYKQENDALARSLGYIPGDLPLLPLVGAVVRETPGLLEVYQANEVFSSGEAVALALAAARTSNSSFVVPPEEHLLKLGDETALFEESPRDDDQQRRVVAITRWGDIIMSLTLKGGRDVTLQEASAYSQEAFARLQSACEGKSQI